MARLELSIICLITYFASTAIAQYADDADYNDYVFYKDLPEKSDPKYSEDVPDDFYIVTDLEEADNPRPDPLNPRPETYDEAEGGARNDLKSPHGDQWYQASDKVYRYTKHRIPGYDYDELEFLDSRRIHKCDEKSVWTHCVCQFTCQEPNIVDCYTPCASGCECKEDYVFDERVQQCVLPEHCRLDDNYVNQ